MSLTRAATVIVMIALAASAVSANGNPCATYGACCFPKKAPDGTPLRKKRMNPKFGTIAVEYGLVKEIVRRYLKRDASALGACGSDDAAGTLELVILASGKGSVASAEGFDATTKRCLSGVVSRMKFPTNSEATHASVPLTFYATNEVVCTH